MIPHARVTSLCRFCCLLFVFTALFLFPDENKEEEEEEEEEERVPPLRCFLNPAGAAAAEAADIFPFTMCVYSNAPRIHKESKRVREREKIKRGRCSYAVLL